MYSAFFPCYCRSVFSFIFLTFTLSGIFGQGQNEDVSVHNVTFQDAPLYFPGGVAMAGFEFRADSGATLNGTYDIGCTVCLGALAFDFDSQNIMDEMVGSGLWMWDNWYQSGTCIIGTITMDLPPGTSGFVYFPVVATEANPQGTPYYSANLVNVNLQPHPFDPSYDNNDNTYGYTYTIPVVNCVDELFINTFLPADTVEVQTRIKSNIKMDQVNPVVFNAGVEACLTPGFEVALGTDFTVNIEACDP